MASREATADRPPLHELRAGRGEQEQRDAGREVDDVVDEVEHGVLGPVEVLEDDERRLLVGEVLEEPAHGPEQLVLGGAVGRQADGRGDPARDASAVRQGAASASTFALASAWSSASVMPAASWTSSRTGQ